MVTGSCPTDDSRPEQHQHRPQRGSGGTPVAEGAIQTAARARHRTAGNPNAPPAGHQPTPTAEHGRNLNAETKNQSRARHS